MAFWTDANEPKRSNRWYIAFTTADLLDVQFTLKKTDKPSMKVNEVKHQYLNHSFYYPGRVEWNPITVTMANINEGTVDNTKALHNIVVQAGYQFPQAAARDSGDNSNNLTTISKKRLNTGIGSVDIIQINSVGEAIEVWSLKNPLFTDIKFSSGLSYESDEIVECSMGIEYDYAILNDPQGNFRASRSIERKVI